MSKTFFAFLLIFSLVVTLFSCKKHSSKFCVEEVIPSKNHVVADSTLEQMGDLLEIIESSGDFQIVKYKTDTYGIHVLSHQFYKGLPLFSNSVIFHNSKVQGIYNSGGFVKEIDIDLEPKVSFTQATNVAHKKISAQACYKAKLGLFNVNSGRSYQEPDFKLVWRITTSGNKYGVAIVDAQNKDLLRHDDGIRTTE